MLTALATPSLRETLNGSRGGTGSPFFLALGGGGSLIVDLREERRQAVVVVLAPLLERDDDGSGRSRCAGRGTAGPRPRAGRRAPSPRDTRRPAGSRPPRRWRSAPRGRTGRTACSAAGCPGSRRGRRRSASGPRWRPCGDCAGPRSTCWRSSRRSRGWRAGDRRACSCLSAVCVGQERLDFFAGRQPAGDVDRDAAEEGRVVATADGGRPSSFSCLKTCSSMKFLAGGRLATGAPSGTVARKTSTCVWKRIMTATLPGSSCVPTRPVSDTSASSAWFDSNCVMRVTSRC